MRAGYVHIVDQTKLPVRGNGEHADSGAQAAVHEALAACLGIVVLGTIEGNVGLHASLPG